MKISDSTVIMSSQTTTIESNIKEEKLKMWVGNNPNSSNASTNVSDQDIINISKESLAKQAKQLMGTNSLSNVNKKDDVIFEISDKDKQKLIAIQKMIEALTGKKIKFYVLDKVTVQKNTIEPLAIKENDINSNNNQQQLKGWGIEYDYFESHYESQVMNFNSQGIVKTSDGREIDFSLSLNLSHEFASSQNISIRAGDALVDPLVINYESVNPRLTEEKYSFDLDCDGKQDQISFVLKGSGFLALDKNNDGVINDGSELFGTQTNNGFKELSAYDSDGNNWIDENDSIYDKLRIWTKDENGNDKLFAIGEKGIGAIYLGNIDTSFNLKNNSNQLEGQIQKTGIFLKENGIAGTIQHIDLVI